MYTIQTMNKISAKGLERLPREDYETASGLSHPDAILVRSYKVGEDDIPPTVKAIARAGAGVNNIPVSYCTDQGIVVFNTPGANANSVKELVLTGLFLSSRNINAGINWVQSLDPAEEVSRLVEKEKSRFSGPEVQGKKLGIIGLGAIGVLVANAALALGMEVTGFDPFISINAAWGLSPEVKKANSMDSLIANSDYITLHIPLNDKTRSVIDEHQFDQMKEGTRLLNFARGGLVNNDSLKKAIESGKISYYITDFPEGELLGNPQIITIPHLGASSPEAEENCAVMAADQLRIFLETGNIRNAVNFPNCTMDYVGGHRLIIANKNIPNMVGQISTLLAENEINIQDMMNKHKEGIAYNIIDTDKAPTEKLIADLKKIEGIIMVRAIPPRD
ncbi:3-phosphoglycerate dehydrogenase [Oceanispirochaeta crateris]|uniref:D-3-phosphoglycerate dehydrogenase n=1 Tax=Oceanispirochaeta crateris TaxID=2518645 RepID=A0A5C1QNG4_9SPIO|nr:phosphoglycerate dehydrogenase [Oceanispirochaeta crateris]QEN09211.1 3-phosphoglycerate dehydrogenase [Oceanispirochaeta crateris]